MPERALDLALSAPVRATDAPIGHVAHVIIDPEHGRATHLVVRESQLPNTLRLVPEKYIAASGPDGVALSIPRNRVAALREYIQTEYYSPSFFLTLAKREHCNLPLAPSSWTVERPATPEGSVALVGHEPVEATDGPVGRVDGVLAEAHTGRITHLLLRRGAPVGNARGPGPGGHGGCLRRRQGPARHRQGGRRGPARRPRGGVLSPLPQTDSAPFPRTPPRRRPGTRHGTASATPARDLPCAGRPRNVSSCGRGGLHDGRAPVAPGRPTGWRKKARWRPWPRWRRS